MKKVLPIGAAVLCGLFTLVDFFVPQPQMDAIGAKLVEGVTILAAFALLLGLLNLLSVHGRRLATKGEGHRGSSLVLLVGLIGTAAIGIALPGSQALAWVFNYLYAPLQGTMTALLAFFAVSALYRAFRLRSGYALVLLVTSLFILAAQLPFSASISPVLVPLRDWLLTVPVTAGVRGIILGIALGTIATSLRVLLAIDRPYAQ